MHLNSPLRLVGSGVLVPPTPFSCSVLCALGWACSVRCLLFLDSVLFSASGVNESQTMHVFGACSLAGAVNPLNAGVFKWRRCLTALRGLHLVKRFARFPRKTVQYQLHKLLRPHKHTLNFQIVLWHDTINKPITPHSSKFYNPLSTQELFEVIRVLPCPVSAIVYCHMTNSPPIFDLLSRSFLTVHAVRHLLSHRKLKNNALVRKYSELHLDISLEFRMFFLISKHISDLRQLTEKNPEQQATTLTLPKTTTTTANTSTTDLPSPSSPASPYTFTPQDPSLMQPPPYFCTYF